MKLAEMNWMQVEAYLKTDDRAVLPIGSTEQHAYLSLSTDCILSERVSLEAAEPLGVPVYPPLNFGVAPYFLAFPGSVSLRVETFLAVLGDILGSLEQQGFRRILIVNGHGGNSVARAWLQEQVLGSGSLQVKFHNWYEAPATGAATKAVDPVASHASWAENFSWTRLPDQRPPDGAKQLVDQTAFQRRSATQVRELIGDGNMGGRYERPDEELEGIWQTAVAETRAELTDGWL